MNNDAPKRDTPLEIAAGAGVLNPEHATPFRVDLDGLEAAQEQYRDVLRMLAETLPLKQWLKWRPPHLTVKDYRAWVESLQGLAREIENAFGVALLTAGPPIASQRERPN